MFFIYDGRQAYLTSQVKETNLKEVGIVKCTEGSVKLLYTGMILKNANINKNTNNIFPLLKSNLQKQVRRGLAEAVVTASEMWDMNTFELLRRLSIIAAEDVTLTLETVNIVWMMTAVSKGFVLSEKMKKWVLNYVYILTKYQICRRLELKYESYKRLNDSLSIKNILESEHPQKIYIAGIFFRYYFGGLAGDLPMLSRLCDDYLLNKKELTSITSGNIGNIGDLQIPQTLKFDICAAAIDFHVYPKLSELIEKDTGYSSDIVKSTIWECSSRMNFRYEEISQLQEIWNEIERSFLFHTKTYLLKILNT